MGLLDKYFGLPEDKKESRYEYQYQKDEEEPTKERKGLLDKYFTSIKEPESGVGKPDISGQATAPQPAAPPTTPEPPWMQQEIQARSDSEFEQRQAGVRAAKREAYGAPQPTVEQFVPTTGEQVVSAVEEPVRTISTFTGRMYRAAGEFVKDVDFGIGLLSQVTNPGMITPNQVTVMAVKNMQDKLRSKGLPDDLVGEIGQKGILYRTARNMEEFGEYLEDGGLPKGLTKEIVAGFGSAAFDIPKLISLGTLVSGGALPVSGAVSAGRRQAEVGGGLGKIIRDGIVGGVEGALMHGILGALGRLPDFLSRVIAGGVFYGTTPGTVEEKISSAITMAALAGGKGTWKEFEKNYRRQPNIEEMLQRSRELVKEEKRVEKELQKEVEAVLAANRRETSMWSEMRPAYKNEAGEITVKGEKGSHKQMLPYGLDTEEGIARYQKDVKAGNVGWVTPGGEFFNTTDLVKYSGRLNEMLEDKFGGIGPVEVESTSTRPTTPERVDLYKDGATVFVEPRRKDGAPMKNRKWVKGKVLGRQIVDGEYQYQISVPKLGMQTRAEGDGWNYINEDFRIRKIGERREIEKLTETQRAERARREEKMDRLIERADENAQGFFQPEELQEWVEHIDSQRYLGGDRRDRSHLALREYKQELRRRVEERYGTDVEEIEVRLDNDIAGNVLKAAKPINDYVEDFEPAIGLTVKFRKGPKIDEINYPEDPENRGAKYWLQSDSNKVEGRYQAARGIGKEPFFKKLGRMVVETAHQFTRKHPELSPNNPMDVRTADILRIFENVPTVAQHSALRVIRGLTAGFSKKEYDLFNRVIVMRDLFKDMSLYPKDKELFFGYESPEAVKRDLEKFEQVVKANPSVETALNGRRDFFESVKRELIKYDLVPAEELADPDYFHRQTLYYINQKNYLGLGLMSKDVRMRQKGFQKKRKPQMKPKDYNTQYLEAEYEVITHSIAQIETAKVIQRLKSTVDMSDAIKAEAQAAGKDWKGLFKDKQESGELEDYTIWKVNPGMNLFNTMTISERLLKQVLEKSIPIDEVPFQELLAVGRNVEWVVPKNIARTFEQVRPVFERYYLGKAAAKLQVAWKQWRLLNPFGVLKYNLNNLSGDLDIAVAYDPRMIKFMPKATKDLANFMLRGKVLGGAKEILEAEQLGVLESGWTAQEIPDISSMQIFNAFTGEKPKLIQRYWKKTKDYTNFREATLRLAAYRFFKQELRKGKKLYGASKKNEIDALRESIGQEGGATQNELAAKLARELIGDYGNISRAGQWIRQSLAPFWSFQEINLPRYYRLVKNLGAEGRSLSAGQAAGKVAVGGLRLSYKAAKLFVLANLMHGMVQIWNHSIYPDEEARLSPDQRRRGHIILGKTGDGRIRTMKFQGALGEALDWFGMEDIRPDITEVIKGQKTVSDKIVDIPVSIIKKAIGVSRPEPKLIYESLTRSQLWPDPFKPKPIRDIGEHVAQVVALEGIYKYVTGKPTVGIGEDLKRLLFYDVDPGESAYWTIRSMAAEFMNKQGKERLLPTPTKKSNALYYYRQALKIKDLKAARKYYERYKELGGTPRGLKISIRNLDPVGGLPRAYRVRFLKDLDEEGKRILKYAQEWYKETYVKSLGQQ